MSKLSKLRTFWVDVVGTDKPKSAVATASKGGAAVAGPTKIDPADDLEAEVAERMAALSQPLAEALAADAEDAEQLKSVFGIVKTSINKKQFDKAAEGLDLLENMLDEQPEQPAPPEEDNTKTASLAGDANLVKGFDPFPDPIKVTVTFRNKTGK